MLSTLGANATWRANADSGGWQPIVGLGRAATTATRYGKPGNLVDGANIAGFLKVAQAMLAQGVM